MGAEVEPDRNQAFYEPPAAWLFFPSKQHGQGGTPEEPELVGPQTFNVVGRGMKDLLKETKDKITQEVEKAGYEVGSILLFGSLPRGNTRPDSDRDFFVVVDEDSTFSEREELAPQICWSLAGRGIYADVFIQSEKTVEQHKANTGYLTYYVFKEGVVL